MNLNKTIVAMYSMDGPDLSVKASKLRNNIRWGREVDPIGGIPAEYVPDFSELHDQETAMGKDAFGVAWAKFEHARHDAYDQLNELWRNKDYDGMIAVMEAGNA